MSFAYSVRIAITDDAAFAAFVTWLREEHVEDVCVAGAAEAELVLFDRVPGEASAIEVRYRFASRAAFARYEANEAPRMRAAGLAELARLGVRADACVMTRSTGVFVDWSR